MAVESAADLAGMFDTSDHADAVEYGRGGTWTTIAAIISTPSDAVGNRGRALAREALVKATDLPDGVWLRSDNIRIGGLTYKVEQAEPDIVGATVVLTLAPVALSNRAFTIGESDIGGTDPIG